MKKAHIILSNPNYAHSKGELNAGLAKVTKEFLTSKSYQVTTTKVTDGYDVEKEGVHFQESDLIVFHFPMHWMYVPHTLKKYIDEVYEYGVFYAPSEGAEYGRNGLLKGKKFAFVVTCNAPEIAFKKQNFFGGRTLDEVYAPFILNQEYCGLEKAFSKGFFNVIKGDTTSVEKEYLHFLEEWKKNCGCGNNCGCK